MDFLDIGGGFTLIFPDTGKNFDEVAPMIGNLLDEIFPEPNIRIIAEPGRYVVESVVYMASKIIGSKIMKSGDRHYYVNNGIYQGYTVRIFGEEQYLGPLDRAIESRPSHNTTWWGQTCDSSDWIIKNKKHPEYKNGEWIITRDFGAYNVDLVCQFNGFIIPERIYLKDF